MKLLRKDRGTGFLHLQVDSLDDLWTLRNLIQEGDRVTASTTRTAEVADDKLRSEKAEKKPMTLSVQVEQVEWHPFDDHLRVLGTIVEGPQDHGRHHTLVFKDEPGTKLKIHKKAGRLRSWQEKQIQEAVAATHRPQVLLLAIDDAEAQFGQLASYGLRALGSLPATGQGKRFGDPEKAKNAFYDEVLRSLKAMRPDVDVPLLVVGPGWWREEFLAHAMEKDPQVVKGAQTDGTSQGGTAGLQEALKRDQLTKVATAHRVQEETAKLEEVLARIAKGDGRVAYGPDEVAQAVTMGAAEEVLITDEAVRAGRHPKVLENAEQTRCHVHVVSTDHDAGGQLQQLGGVAALLRYPIA